MQLVRPAAYERPSHSQREEPGKEIRRPDRLGLRHSLGLLVLVVGAVSTLTTVASAQASHTSKASPGGGPGFQQALQAAQTEWGQGAGAQFLASFRNGQCTDWAAQKRPDIVESIWAQSIANGVLTPGQPSTIDFTAKNWAALAQAAGLTVKNTPVVGAIAVWQPGVDGGVTTGHVGYVESVSASGATFATSEMNDLGVPYRMIYRTLSSAPLAGRTFIYPPPGFTPEIAALDKPAFNPATNGSRAFSDTAKHQ